MKRALCAIALVLLSGCSLFRIYHVDEEQTIETVCRQFDDATFRDIIVAAGKERGWEVYDETVGNVYLTLHGIKIRVEYLENRFLIEYVDSRGMGYDSVTGEIGSTYVRWVRNLKVSVKRIARETDG